MEDKYKRGIEFSNERIKSYKQKKRKILNPFSPKRKYLNTKIKLAEEYKEWCIKELNKNN